MDVEQLRQLVSQPRESVKLDVKIAPYKLDESEEHWAELVKDVLALTNGNTGTATQNAFLIIGADDKLKPDGTPNLRDVIEKVPTSTDILRKVNKYCYPRLVDLSAEIVSLNGKQLFIISIPPSPYLHKLSQQLKTPKKEYSPHTLLVRRGDGEETYEASDEEKKVLQQEKEGIQAIHQDWQQVCLMMLERQKKLSTNEVIASESMQFDLLNDKIFVSLALVERREPDRLSQDVHPARSAEQYEEKTPIAYEQFREQVLQQGTIDRIAIIGDPGAGKTTLLQHIAFWTLDQHLGLPIWISLGDLIKSGDLQRLKDYLTQVWLEDAIPNVTENVRADFLEQLNKQQVWLLLDGADEIVASSGIALREIDNQLRSWLSQSCIILTCRVNVWDADINALRYFQTYRTKEFHYPTQVEQFIENGFRKSNQPSGERLKAELAKTERGRLQQLVRNPLRLMMLCTTWHEQESLPLTKADLYERFVSEFYKWNRKKWKKKDLNYALFPNTKARQEKLDKALGRLACCALDKEQAPFRLPHNLVFDELGDPDEEGSNFWLALNLGWLQVARNSDEPSEKVYAFFHPTFQEYFAALAIDDPTYFLDRNTNGFSLDDKQYLSKVLKKLTHPWLQDNPSEEQIEESIEEFFYFSMAKNFIDSITRGNYRVFEDCWREVILIWFGRSNLIIDQKNLFIDNLLSFKDYCSGFYGLKAFFIAAEAISEFSHSEHCDEIVQKLTDLAFGNYDDSISSWVRTSYPLNREAQFILTRTDYKSVISRLENMLDICTDEVVSWEICKSLREIEPENPKIITTLKNLFLFSENIDAIYLSLESLEDIIRTDRQLISILFDAISLRQDARISEDIREVIQRLETSEKNARDEENEISPKVDELDDPKVVYKLIETLRNNKDRRECIDAVSMLEDVLLKSLLGSVIQGLKDCFLEQTKEDDYWRSSYCFMIMWHCAQNMSYLEFWKAWYGSSCAQNSELDEDGW